MENRYESKGQGAMELRGEGAKGVRGLGGDAEGQRKGEGWRKKGMEEKEVQEERDD